MDFVSTFIHVVVGLRDYRTNVEVGWEHSFGINVLAFVREMRGFEQERVFVIFLLYTKIFVVVMYE